MSGKFRIAASVSLVIGAAAAVAIVVYSDAGAVVGWLRAGGPALLAVVPWALVPMVFAAASWRLLFMPSVNGRQQAPGFGRLLTATWIGLSVNWLLPVAQVGGEVVKARWIARDSCPAAAAAASVVTDQTLQVVSQILFALAGVVLLAAAAGAARLTLPAAAAALILAVAVGVFYRAQRAGLFGMLSRWVKTAVPALHRQQWDEAAARLDRHIGDIYRGRGRVFGAFLLRMAFRFAGAGEIWLVMQIIGHPVGIVEAVAVESMVQIARGAAFAIPGGLGAQEGALVLAFGAVGFGPDVAVAVAAAKRLREVTVGVPGIALWQVSEARYARSLLRRGPDAQD